MGIFERKRVELQEQGANVVVASAQRIDLTDKGVARSYKKLQAQHAGWKSEAWRFYDELGEIWFGHNFVGNSLSRIRVFAADEADTDEPPAAIDDLTDPARVEVERLENGDGTAAMLHAIGIMMGVPGEGILLGYIDPEDSQEKWGFYSCDQVFINASQKWALRREPQDKTGIALDPETTVMVRLWRNHPRFRELSDSPMRPLLLLCDELQILSRTIRGAARSRLAGAGLLLWPSEAVPKPADETRQYAPGEIPFVQEWIEAAGTAIGDEASAMGVVPLFTTIPADYIEKVKHLDFNRPTDPIAAEQRKEIIQRISFGLDIPGEVLTGMAKTSHWTAWAIDEQTFKAHLEPLIISVCGALTRGFLWPALRAHGLTEEQLKKKIIWYDASGLLGHPNRAQDAKDAHNSLVISDDALRQHLGFSETDAPSPEELERRIAVAKGSLDPASVLLILQHVLDTNVPSPAPAPAPTPLPAPGQPAIDATASEPTNQAKENAPPVKPTTDQPKGPSGIAASAAFEFNPDQPRDEHGRWGSGGSGDATFITTKDLAVDRNAESTRVTAREADKTWPMDAKNGVANYMNFDYLPVNEALRTGNTDVLAPKYADTLTGMDHAFEAPGTVVTSQDIVVYRSADEYESAERFGETGSKATDNGFPSTTTDIQVLSREGLRDAGAVLRITVPAGTPVVAGTHWEKELILNRGTTFESTAAGKPWTDGPTRSLREYDTEHLTVYDVKVVPS